MSKAMITISLKEYEIMKKKIETLEEFYFDVGDKIKPTQRSLGYERY